jgi:Ni/Co efflux regulator RcnB
MKKLLNLLAILAMVVVISSCGEKKAEEEAAATPETAQTEVKETKALSIREIYAAGVELEDKIISVHGKIDHICRNSKKRVTIVDSDGKFDMKLEFEEAVDTNSVIPGKHALAKGKLLPSRMNLEQVKEWKEWTIEHHKGMEDTDHYKEDIKFIDGIISKIEAGEIEQYTNYSFAAEECIVIDEPAQ